MRSHIPVSHPPPAHHWQATVKEHIASQPFKDRLYVIAVSALVVATLALALGYAIHEWPRWRSGGVGGFDSAILPLPDRPGFADTAPEASATAQPGVNRTTLIMTSMLVDAAIFVALGLYLRHEMKRKP